MVNTQTVGDHAIELTATGHQQAAASGATIGRGFLAGALIYTSPFRRTRQALDGILAGAKLARPEAQVYEDPRLREVDHGYTDVPEQQPLQDRHGKFYYRFHGGESPADCYDRTSGFLEGLMRQVQRKDADRVLIVTHGLTIRCFVMRFLHLTVEQFDTKANPANCDVITIAGRGSVTVPSFATSQWAVSGLRLKEPPTAVSRESARTIGSREITARCLGKGVSSVCSVDEAPRLPTLYNGPPLAGCWLVYAEQEDAGRGLRSSNVVLIDQGSGEVLYAGCANDEG